MSNITPPPGSSDAGHRDGIAGAVPPPVPPVPPVASPYGVTPPPPGATVPPPVGPGAFQDGPDWGGAGPIGAGSPAPVKRGLAITALVLGIVGILSILLAPLAIILGILAVIFGIVALVRQQPRVMGIIGLVLGALAIIGAIIWSMVFVNLVKAAVVELNHTVTYDLGASVSTGSATVTYGVASLDGGALEEVIISGEWSETFTAEGLAAVVIVEAEEPSAVVTCEASGIGVQPDAQSGQGTVQCTVVPAP